jgi:hypothetical protein
MTATSIAHLRIKLNDLEPTVVRKRQPMTAVFELGVDPGVGYFCQRQGSSSSMRWMG